MKKISYTVQYFKEKHAICGYILFTLLTLLEDGIILIFGAFIPLNCVDDFHRRSFLNFQTFLFKQSRFELTLVCFCGTLYLPPSAAIATAPLGRLGRGRRLLVSLRLRLRWRRRWGDNGTFEPGTFN
jgi:hypothetical protein